MQREQDRHTIEIHSTTPEARRLWQKVLQLAEALGGDAPWVLIGGLMVQLHGFEHGDGSRPTVDIDLLGDSRQRPAMTEQIAAILVSRGGRMEAPPVSDERLGYKFDLDGETIEILGSDGVRRDPKTIGKYVTFQVPGGTQALHRAEAVWVSLDDAPAVAVRRPSLLGAILIKARAVARKRRVKFESDCQDLVRLLSFAGDPRALAEEVSSKEKKWLRDVEPLLELEDPALIGAFSPNEVVAAAQSLRLLTIRSRS